MGLAAILRESLAPAVDLVYPPRCPLCGEGIEAQSGLCAGCWTTLSIPGEPACLLCQRPFADTLADGMTCAPCLAEPPHHDGIAAATLYNEASRKLVLAFKHGRRIALAPMLARLMLARLPSLDESWLIVPVPLHRWRLWRRGYNQAALLARELARATGASLQVDVLRRTRATPTLGGLGKVARRRALRGAIRIHPRAREALKCRKVVLVDDVLTSGATSDACVAQLKRAGAEAVVIACFARVIDETGTPGNTFATNETPGV
jgi:ComF family protein